MDLFDVVKAAVLEALVEFANQGIAVSSDGPLDLEEAPKDPENTVEENDNGGNHGETGNNSEDTSGGGLNDGRPIPDVGVGGFSLRP